jgi:hypothetical protein
MGAKDWRQIWAGINGGNIERDKLGGKKWRQTIEHKFLTQHFWGKFISH